MRRCCSAKRCCCCCWISAISARRCCSAKRSCCCCWISAISARRCCSAKRCCCCCCSARSCSCCCCISARSARRFCSANCCCSCCWISAISAWRCSSAKICCRCCWISAISAISARRCCSAKRCCCCCCCCFCWISAISARRCCSAKRCCCCCCIFSISDISARCRCSACRCSSAKRTRCCCCISASRCCSLYSRTLFKPAAKKPKGEQTRQVCATRVGNPKRKYTHRIYIYTKYISINIHTRNNAESTHEYTHVQMTHPHILTRDISRKQKGRQPETSRRPFLFQSIGASPWCHSPSNGRARQNKIVVVGGWGNFVFAKRKVDPAHPPLKPYNGEYKNIKNSDSKCLCTNGNTEFLKLKF